MYQLKDFLKNTKETTFLEFLDEYSDAELTFEKKGNTYTFRFPETALCDSATTELVFDIHKNLIEVHCSCEKEDDDTTYCVHELGAYIKYLEMIDSQFDIMEYLLNEDVNGNKKVFCDEIHENFDEDYEAAHFDDFQYELLDELGIDEDEIDEFLDYDVSELLSDLSHEELLEFIKEVANTYPIAKLAIIQHVGELTQNAFDESYYDDEDEDSLEQQLKEHYQFRNQKPS